MKRKNIRSSGKTLGVAPLVAAQFAPLTAEAGCEAC